VLTLHPSTPTFHAMFIRMTTTRNKLAAESYFTFRLVASERTGSEVRQISLLNLGRHFDLPQPDWPRLCARIDALLAGQSGLLPEPEAIEVLAQRFAARLIAAHPGSGEATAAAAPPHVPAPVARSAASITPVPVYAEVDITSLQLTRPRAVGVEAAGLAAMKWLGIDRILTALGFNGVQRDAVAGLLIGRMAAPGSEMATWRWLRERSALGELLDADFEAMPPIRLYRTSDLLVRHRDKIEAALFATIKDLFGLPVTVTLYDLTNTYFERPRPATPRPPAAARKRSAPTVPWSPWASCWTAAGLSADPACSPATRRRPERFRTCSRASRPRTARWSSWTPGSPRRPTSHGSKNKSTATLWSAANAAGNLILIRRSTR
jgi:hypothetical protein